MSMAIPALFPPVASQLQPLSAGESTSGGFGDVMKDALNQVASLQGGAEQQVGTLLAGGNADMGKVMISVEKADVAFQLMMQVRNKIVSAYQDIEKMQF
ncbi:MAG TPA: flagellar hook-basal body complex protein FliE [Acidobacteriaceae bacterium]